MPPRKAFENSLFVGLFLLSTVLTAACNARTKGPTAPMDAGRDASRDTGIPLRDTSILDVGIVDVGVLDTGTREVGPSDVGVDASQDASRDAGMDARVDAGRDAGTDAGRDVGTDASRDVGVDARDAVIDAGPASPVRAIATGGYFSCAIQEDGRARCWGDGDNGQFGDGTSSSTYRSRPGAFISNLTTVQTISAGYQHACALLAENAVQCWGWNDRSQVVYGGSQIRSVPESIANLASVAQVSASMFKHTCAVHTDGTLSCWGNNSSAQGGAATTTTTLTPTLVSGISNAAQVAGGNNHTCVLLADNTVSCFGNNGQGQLGDNSLTSVTRATPGVIPNLSGVVAVSSGDRFSCALLMDGHVMCWGDNDDKQLGAGSNDSRVPVQVAEIEDATALVSGANHSCALRTGGTISCWGSNNAGQLGGGSVGTVTGPVNVMGIINAIQVSAGDRHTCALLTDRSILCWGENTRGQLGIGSLVNQSMPTAVVF